MDRGIATAKTQGMVLFSPKAWIILRKQRKKTVRITSFVMFLIGVTRGAEKSRGRAVAVNRQQEKA
jgi:hypothetical protein